MVRTGVCEIREVSMRSEGVSVWSVEVSGRLGGVSVSSREVSVRLGRSPCGQRSSL